MEDVLVDAQDRRAAQPLALLGLALGILGVNAPHRGRSEVPAPGRREAPDPALVVLVELLTKRLAEAVPEPDPRQVGTTSSTSCPNRGRCRTRRSTQPLLRRRLLF